MAKQKELALDNVVDEAENDSTVPAVRYDITSFGADYDVDGLVRRMNRKETVGIARRLDKGKIQKPETLLACLQQASFTFWSAISSIHESPNPEI